MNAPINDEPPDGEKDIDRVLNDLKRAEHDLERAREEERHAEAEILEAERELEKAIEHRETEIIVNSRPRVVHARVVTFEEVVQLAFPGGASNPNTVFSMTYRHAASNPHAGELGAGGKVEVKNGTVFNVTRTIRS